MNSLFGPDLLGQMLSAVPVAGDHPVFRRPAYGLGVMLGASELEEMVGHGGAGPGYSAGVLHWLAERLTCVALVDRDAPEAGLILAHELGLSFRN
ncbi:hypothetical protein [Deinococcus sp.]|uniref:hypothetical protein n=1 Tax=Deinococcus sp. TaxID=47478 RepID=UPI003C79BF70